jgi:hypothetical protein
MNGPARLTAWASPFSLRSLRSQLRCTSAKASAAVELYLNRRMQSFTEEKRTQYRCLAFFNDIFGTAHGMGRIDVDDMPGNKPVEQHPERGQVLLDCGRRKPVLQIFDEGGHVERLDLRKLENAVAGTPVSEAACGIHVGAASVIVADLGCEKFQNAFRRFRRGCKKRRLEVRRRRDNEVPYHV